MRLIAIALFCALAHGQNTGFRLGYVRSVYIEDLGNSEPAKIVRAQLIGAIVSRSNLGVEGDKTKSHAILSGSAMLFYGERSWAISSSASSSAAAAVATPTITAAAASSNSASSLGSGRSTIRITELGLQLADEDGHVLWAFDPSNCTGSWIVDPYARKPVLQCAVEQLIKAINKDAKKTKGK